MSLPGRYHQAPNPLIDSIKDGLSPMAGWVFVLLLGNASSRRTMPYAALTNQGIGDALGLTSSHVQRLIGELERAGLVKRPEGNPGPGRSLWLAIDHEGDATREDAERPVVNLRKNARVAHGEPTQKCAGIPGKNAQVEAVNPRKNAPPHPISQISKPDEDKSPPNPPTGVKAGGGISSSTPGKTEDPGTEAEAVGRKAIADARALQADPDCAKRIGLKARRAVEAGEAVALVQRTVEAVARQVAKNGGPGLVEKAWRETIEAERLAGEDEPAPAAAPGVATWDMLPAEERQSYDTAARRLMQLLRNRKEVIEGATHDDAVKFMAESGWKYGEFKLSGRLYRFIEGQGSRFFTRLEGSFHDTARKAYLDLARATWGGEKDRDWMLSLAREVIAYVCDDPSDEAARNTYDYGRIATECRQELPSQWDGPTYKALTQQARQKREQAARTNSSPYDEEEDDRNPIRVNSLWADPPKPPADPIRAAAEKVQTYRSGAVHIADLIPTMVPQQAATA